MLSSPLILGNDPRVMSRTTLSILTARELVAINQDPLAQQAKKV
jgi:alpha-galactosidase